MHVLEAKVCEATLRGSRVARRKIEVNSIEMKAFEAISPHEGLRGRKWRCTFLRRWFSRRQIYEATLCGCKGWEAANGHGSS